MRSKMNLKGVGFCFLFVLLASLLTAGTGCGLSMDEERAMLDAERDVEQMQSELSIGGFGVFAFDMDQCIEDCKEDNENDGTIENLQVYCETRCKFREIFGGLNGANTVAY